MGVGCCHCQQISVPGSIAPPKLRTAKCAWVDSTSKTQGIGVGDRSRKRNTSRCFDAWSRFAHHCVKLLQNMVYSTIQQLPPAPHATPPPHTATHWAVNLVWEGGGRGGQREGRGATVHKYSSFVHGACKTVHKLGQKYQP